MGEFAVYLVAFLFLAGVVDAGVKSGGRSNSNKKKRR